MKYASLLLFFCLILNLYSSQQDCPTSCHCTAEDSFVYSVNCSFRKLKEFPQTLPVSTTKLNVSGNSIVHLLKTTMNERLKSFSEITTLDLSENLMTQIDHDFFLDFPKLEYLYLKRNKLTEVPVNLPPTLHVLQLSCNEITDLSGLGHLTGLKEIYLHHNNVKLDTFFLHQNQGNDTQLETEIIDLSENHLTEIDGNIFKSFPKLKHLSIKNNKISNLKFLQNLFSIEVLDLRNNSISESEEDTFNDMSNLRYLSLSYNNFVVLPKGLPSLEWLDMSYNNISELNEDNAKGELYPHDVFLLGGNPFLCDCHLQWLKDLYDLRVYLLKYIDVSLDKYIPVCASPEQLAGKSWASLHSDQFVCTKRVTGLEHKSEDNLLNKSPTYDLHANFIGKNYVKLQWTSIMEQGGRDRMPAEVIIKYRVFGQKTSWTDMSVTSNVGVFTLHDLEPSTAYVICIEEGRNSKEKNCIEVFTTDLELNKHSYWWIMLMVVITGTFILVFACLIKLCHKLFKNRVKIKMN